MNSLSNSVNLLLVEDSRGDAELMVEALKEYFPEAQPHIVHDGEEALDFLRRRNKHAQAPQADMIVLDLNLPRMSGFELLESLKADDELRRMPAIVFTSSEAPHDIQECYRLHANCYIVKSIDLEFFYDKIKGIAAFWTRVATLPSGQMQRAKT